MAAGDHGSDQETALENEQAAIAEVIQRTRFAKELGYGVTGEKTIWGLTYPEIRTYSDGLRLLKEREIKRENARYGDGAADGQVTQDDKDWLDEYDQDLQSGDAPTG